MTSTRLSPLQTETVGNPFGFAVWIRSLNAVIVRESLPHGNPAIMQAICCYPWHSRIASSLQPDIFCAALIGEEDFEGSGQMSSVVRGVPPFHRAPEEVPR
ncbi:Uncharacterized protein HZ326_1102 [Fusarium oxysporum f. sp. albedinis]|nr:Uncharacterized protein HZ326_1102 [Fusarium oxysporum f. sp. albedinis]